MTGRETSALILLAFVIIWGVIVATDMVDPQRKYRQHEEYCKYDFDCGVVYDMLQTKCFTVNTLHQSEYETDVSCRRRSAKCVRNQCYLP